MTPWKAVADGVRLAVRLTPRAARDGMDGIAQDAEGRPVLKLRLTAAPVEGAANAALIAFLAKKLGVRQAAVTLHSGETGRLKILHLAGDPAVLCAALERFVTQK